MRLQGLDMGIDLDGGAELGGDCAFQAVGYVMRLAEREPAVDFQVERDRQAILQVVDGHMMDGKRAVARDDHDAIDHGLVVERHRIGGDGRLGAGQMLANGGGDLLLERADAIERHRAADGDGEIDECLFADGAGAHLLDRDHARYLRGGGGDLLGGACRRHVGKGVDGAPAEPPAGKADQDRHRQRGNRIRPPQSERARRQVRSARPARPTGRMKNAAHRLPAPGFWSPWRCATARASGRNRPDRHRDHPERPGIGDHRVLFMFDQALDRFPNHHARQQEQQRGFRQRRDAFELSVAVLMLFVGRLAGNAHREHRSSPWRRDRSANGRPPTRSPASR